MFLSFWIFLPGCFRGLFTEELRYQATEYVITSPRIVAIRSNPVNMIANEAVELDILLLAPQNHTIQNYSVDVCGLGNQTQTIIWDLSCFEDASEVQRLASSNSTPMRFGIPNFPTPDCGVVDSPRYETGLWDTASQDTGPRIANVADCSHHLPLFITATVDDVKYYAGAFTQWYGENSEMATGGTALSSIPMGLSIIPSANSKEYNLLFQAQSDLRDATIHWYIDAGELLQTGLTAVTEFTEASNSSPHGLSKSHNTLIPPPDYRGRLRVWVVVHYPWYHQLDMAWVSSEIEVEP